MDEGNGLDDLTAEHYSVGDIFFCFGLFPPFALIDRRKILFC